MFRTINVCMCFQFTSSYYHNSDNVIITCMNCDNDSTPIDN